MSLKAKSAVVAVALSVQAGTLEVNGEKFTITNVYARKGPAKFDKKKETIQLIAVDRELPLEVRTDPSAISDLMFDGKLRAMEFEIDGDSVHYSLRTGPGGTLSGSRSPNPFAMTITATRVKGKIQMEDRESTSTKYAIEVEFDSPIERAPVVAPPTAADTAAAQKSEATKAYQALQAALMKGDKATMMKIIDPEKAKMMDTPDFPEMLKFVQSMQAKNIKVLKATETAEAAELLVTGDAGKQKGKVALKKMDGQWRVMKESWTNAN
ncbi:MAG: hypothetical protein FJW30_24845 [Acidobacteria bacterium]|nr:hypothetical protein [Acidobacteriota bacterium]